MEKTYYPKAHETEREWVLVDAGDQILGRVATEIAGLLLGKHKPNFTPGVEMGDYVVVINASKIRTTGKKMAEKVYNRHSGYVGGLKSITLQDQLERYPERVIQKAVWGMLPHNKLGRKLISQMKVYAGSEHPHKAQKPKSIR